MVFRLSSLGLSERSLERPRIDLKKNITLFNQTAFLVIARDNVALHLGVDVGVDKTIEGRNPFENARHIARLNRCHQNFRRSRTGLRCLARAPRLKQESQGENSAKPCDLE